MTRAPGSSLPPPLNAGCGWPWEPHTPSVLVADDTLPSIALVTPSFNQGRYLEQTIRSVLLQGYPRLEYYVMDGGSRDDSQAVIQHYAPWLTGWVSEPDKGQSDALVKGLALCKGEWFNWINSDDLLEPGALAVVATATVDADVVCGPVLNFHDDGRGELFVQEAVEALTDVTRSRARFHQPGTFLRREVIEAIGGIDTTLHYVFDYDLMLRYLARASRVRYVTSTLARFRLHEASKTVSRAASFDRERLAVLAKLADLLRGTKLGRDCGLALERAQWWRDLEAALDTAADRPSLWLALGRLLQRQPRPWALRAVAAAATRAPKRKQSP